MEALFEGGERIAQSISNWAKAPISEKMDLVQLSAATIFVVSLAIFTATAMRKIADD